MHLRPLRDQKETECENINARISFNFIVNSEDPRLSMSRDTLQQRIILRVLLENGDCRGQEQPPRVLRGIWQEFEAQY